MDPAVLILSYGAMTPLEIAEGILSEMDQPKEPTSTEGSLNCYKCTIKNKYYNTTINLVPAAGKLENVPEDILKATEALIIYFDPTETSFIDSISKTLAENHQIQLGFLLTSSNLSDSNGVSISDLKERTNFFFDVITLNSDDETDPEDSENGYEEVVEGLKNIVWSNVNYGSNESKPEMSTDELDSQLRDFENLLLTAQSLRNDTSLTREQFLDRAEQFAGIVSSILNDNDSD
ncbi:hypothetical protein KR026_003960 [Drosophila bipectinata]|nr:hypothetical protein KR026_003960 [Drosophila bipectinata]